MKFLVDAHLPPRLCAVLQAAGHDAIHTSRLAAKNLPAIVTTFATNSLVELDRQTMQVVV